MAEYTGYEIAVIGISGRFPGAETLGEYWQNLKNGVESITPLNEAQLEAAGEVQRSHPSYVRASAYLQNKAYFDAAFFNYTPDEATLMDPQMRIMHECVWQAIEDAGYNVLTYEDRIGLFTGATANLNWQTYAKIENLKNRIDDYTLPHVSSVNFINTRISYLLNLRGPSVFVNSACSTSLVAIHQACNSLLLGECRMALAGGVTVTNSPPKGYLYREGMILSEDGHCRTFDAQATGTIGSEGVGIVVLKRLKKALEDKDHIYAIIKGTGINNDGNNKVGYTAPSVDGQTEVIMMARKMAKVPAESIGYVEAHGTATKLGDPIEVEGLKRAFGKSQEKYCALGSVKTNIGHADAAAGVAGFIKVVLALYHKQIPPSLHFQHPNPKIDFQNTPFYVNTEPKDWKNDRYPLRAAVSAFGIGGTNAHLILEEAPAQKPASPENKPYLLTLSAKTETALKGNMARLLRHLQENKTDSLADIAYTLQVGRGAFPYRKALVCTHRQEAIEALSSSKTTRVPSRVGSVVFLFSGQGSQYLNMGRDLYLNEKTFRQEVDSCLGIIQRLSGKDFQPILFAADGLDQESKIHQTEYTQPALFVIEYALAKLLMSWGIQPDKLIGHSIGEYAAACIGGVFSLENALYLVIRRGELMQRAQPGSMLSVAMSEQELQALLAKHPGIALAAINSSEKCVVSGENEAITAFQSLLEQQGHTAKMVKTSHAFHSHMMDGLLRAFEQEVRRVSIHSPQIPIISTLTGKPVSDVEMADPRYWVRQLRQTVQFSAGIGTLLQEGPTIFVETGPGRILSSFVHAHAQKQAHHSIFNLLRHPRENENDHLHLLRKLGQLWVQGIKPDWKKCYRHEERRRVSLPGYSFDRIEYPTLVDAFAMIEEMIGKGGTTKQKDINQWLYRSTWKLSPRLGRDGKSQTGQVTLLLADEAGTCKGLMAALRNCGEKVIWVQSGPRFVKQSSTHYQLNPAAATDFKRLWMQLAAEQTLPHRIIHGWGVTAEQAKEELPAALDTYFFSLVSCLHAAAEQAGLAGKQLTVLTNGLHPVLDRTVSSPQKALSLGLLKVLAQEFPTAISKHIDFSLAEEQNGAFFAALAQEIRDERPGKVVSFRSAQRWEQTVEKIEPSPDSHPSPIQPQGVYLVTGGLGELGLTVASHLLEKYEARLILLGRSSLSSEKQAILEELASKGGSVHYWSCNIGRTNELARTVALAEQTVGPIKGIIHAAGLISGPSVRPFAQLHRKDYLAQFEAKVVGLQALRGVFKDKKLDFCVLTSSLSTVLGGLNFAAYASANTFMDYFVRSAQATGELTNWISLNLDGLALNQPAGNLLNAEELLAVIERSLSLGSLPQIAVSTTDLPQRIEKWVSMRQQEPETPDGAAQEGRQEALAQLPAGLTETEAQLLLIWQTFFGKKDLEVTDSFFEVGGDSLKALNMIGRIQKLLAVSLGVQAFFEHPTIARLAAYIETQRSSQTVLVPPRIQRVEKRAYYPASSAQERMLYEQMTNFESLNNNIPRVFCIEGNPDVEKIQQTFQQLIDRHESLRTCIAFEGDQIVQRINEGVKFELQFLEESQVGTVKAAFEQFVQPFDLSDCPLFRGAIYRHHQEGTLLLIDTHHVVCDGLGLDVLMKEFIQLYAGQALAPTKLRYIDYAFWQKSQSAALLAQQQYWARQLSGDLPRLNLPTIQDRDEVQIYAGAKTFLHLSGTEAQRIRRFAAEANLSEFMLLLAVYSILLHKITGEEDLLIGTDALGRSQAELNPIVGTFINVLPLRIQLSEQMSIQDLLELVKKTVLDGVDNQDFQYEKMYAQVELTEKRPLVDVYFSHAILFEKESDFQDLGFVPYPIERPETTTRYELELNLTEQGEELVLTFLYSTDLYDAATIELFRTYFLKLLSELLKGTVATIEEIEVEASAEINQV